MRLNDLSIFCDSQLKSHEEWLMSRLEKNLELDPNESKYYARFLISVFASSPDEIDPELEEELFIYNRPSPNANHTDIELMVDKRSSEQVAVDELVSVAPVGSSEAVFKIISRLRRRLEPKRRRINSYVSETSSSSSSSLSTYEYEFPSLGPDQQEKFSFPQMAETNIEKTSEESNYRFAFKNPRQRQEKQKGRRQPQAKKKFQSLKKPKNPDPQQHPQDEPTSGKRKRRRNRKKKKNTKQSGGFEVQIIQNANFDRLSIEEALEFVKNLSGQSEDQELWKNMVTNHHVKYTNGTFFFTPRLNIPSDHEDVAPPNTPDRFELNQLFEEPTPEDPNLAHAASVAVRAAEIIFDGDSFDDLSAFEIAPPPSIVSPPPDGDTEPKWALPKSFTQLKQADWMSIW